MRFILTLLICVLSIPALAQNTLPYLDGVPIMQGFSLSDDDVIMFDKPQGRVVDITIWCTKTCPTNNDIDAFYNQSMGKLGWNQNAPRAYTHNRTNLNYNIIRGDHDNSVIILFQSNG